MPMMKEIDEIGVYCGETIVLYQCEICKTIATAKWIDGEGAKCPNCVGI